MSIFVFSPVLSAGFGWVLSSFREGRRWFAGGAVLGASFLPILVPLLIVFEDSPAFHGLVSNLRYSFYIWLLVPSYSIVVLGAVISGYRDPEPRRSAVHKSMVGVTVVTLCYLLSASLAFAFDPELYRWFPGFLQY